MKLNVNVYLHVSSSVLFQIYKKKLNNWDLKKVYLVVYGCLLVVGSHLLVVCDCLLVVCGYLWLFTGGLWSLWSLSVLLTMW